MKRGEVSVNIHMFFFLGFFFFAIFICLFVRTPGEGMTYVRNTGKNQEKKLPTEVNKYFTFGAEYRTESVPYVRTLCTKPSR